jgi:hypothetical protein
MEVQFSQVASPPSRANAMCSLQQLAKRHGPPPKTARIYNTARSSMALSTHRSRVRPRAQIFDFGDEAARRRH